MGPKYEFTDETKNYDGHLLHRIRRLSDGKFGGWIESEKNLSQEGNCWVDGEAIVFEDAKVSGNAQVYGKAEVSYDAKVKDIAYLRYELYQYQSGDTIKVTLIRKGKTRTVKVVLTES